MARLVLLALVACSLSVSGEKNVQPDAFQFPVTPSDVIVVIRNDRSSYSIEKAKKIKSSLLKQAKETQDGFVVVKMLHEPWAPFASWTVLTMIESIYKKYNEKKWIFFCEDTTQIDLRGLLAVLSTYNHNKDMFLGHSLHDTEAAIIHHFKNIHDPTSFKYPDFDAGWAISKSLLKKTNSKLQSHKSNGFSIDVKYEVAEYFFENGNGSRLTNVDAFCVNRPLETGVCVTTVQHQVPSCGVVDADKIFVAVKTCKKFHDTRVPVVQQTMGLHAKHMVYYSDVADASIPTVDIKVANTKRGHCEKLYTILQQFNEQKKIEWFVVIDDDTIMSFPRLQRMLACYDSSETMTLGERYGYIVNQYNHGYNYPTGGGGMVFTRSAVHRILSEGHKCGKADDPDDMWVGNVVKNLNIPVIPTYSFHQTTPNQYSQELLSHQYLVSFHKHYNIDPLQVYKQYLSPNDQPSHNTKQEL